MRTPLPLIGASAVVGGLLVAAFVAGSRSAGGRADRYVGPTILERVQALGQLHTISHRYSNTFEAKSAMEPDGVAGHLPGVPQLVAWSTGNTALVTADGSVEAGVDLRKAKVEGSTLVLPRATIYPGVVDVRLHDSKRGLVWRDAELPLKARREAMRRFRDAAEIGHIRDAAETEAVTRVQTLLKSTASPMIVVVR